METKTIYRAIGKEDKMGKITHVTGIHFSASKKQFTKGALNKGYRQMSDSERFQTMLEIEMKRVQSGK